MKENLARQYEPQGELQREFETKNEVLRSRFVELSPEDYLSTIFPDKGGEDELVVVLGTLKNKEGKVIERGTVTRVGLWQIWSIAWRSNAYIPYCDFKRNYYHSRTLEAVRAFVVDLDKVTSRNLSKILRYAFKQIPEPTHVVNSGRGVHLIYALSKPQLVKGWRWSIRALNEAIQNAYEKVGHLDKHPVVHPYRFPGFTTRINTTATVFKVREQYTTEELMELFKIPRKKGSQAQGKARSGRKEGKGKVIYFPNGKRAFFEWALWKLFMNPPIPGRRHNSFFALGIIAYKCKREVPKWEAVEAVDMVYDDMERYNLHIGFTREEAHRAFEKGYNPKAVTVTWKYLSGLLGWEYRPNKRNGRTREEHCAYMNYIKSAKAKFRRKEVMPMVWLMLEDGLSIRQISSMLGIPRSTLSRWIKQEELES
jgi:hypothetical protein